MAEILCIGSVLWDVIGRSNAVMRQGSDVPGRISRLPGGVALNIAMMLARFGLRPSLLSCIGQDREGEELIAACTRLGLETRHIYRSQDLPTDRYMAVEGANGLIAAIADAHSLEAAGPRILTPFESGALPDPWTGLVALDGNLTLELLADIAQSPVFAGADLRVAPASPGKADRLRPLIAHPRATLYVNREEAGILCQTDFPDAARATDALIARGAARVVVTDGGRTAAEASRGQPTLTGAPPPVMVTRVTGAGDTFMAAHIAAETRGATRSDALSQALARAATYVSGEIGS